MKSPCISRCKVVGKYCQGCYRTLSEITDWRRYNDSEKKKVLELIKKRKVKHEVE